MKKLRMLSREFYSDESGATAIEYALIIGLIGIAIVAGATALGTAVNNQFTDTVNQFPT